MRRRDLLRNLARWGLALGTVGFSGCGTIFYKERLGQPHSRDVDWKVAALNGLGLALFFVPGVIAFAVDFYTGAIYLPPEYPDNYPEGPDHSQQQIQLSQQQSITPKRALPPPAWQGTHTGELQCVMVPRGELQPEHIEDVVSDRIGRQISLRDANARVSKLPHLDRFAEQCRHHNHDDGFGITARAFFAPFLTS